MASICLANHRSQSQALATLAAMAEIQQTFGYRIHVLIDAQESPQIRFYQTNLCDRIGHARCHVGFDGNSCQGPQTKKDEPPMMKPSQDQLVDGIQWSNWGDRDGLMSGARLILPEGGVKTPVSPLSSSIVEEFVHEYQEFLCYVRSNWQYITPDTRNHIIDMGIDLLEKPIEINHRTGQRICCHFPEGNDRYAWAIPR